MAWRVGESDDLVFDGRAVPWPGPLNGPRVHRGAVQVVPDHLMGLLVGPGDVTRVLRQLDAAVVHGHGRRGIVSRLNLQAIPVDGLPIQSGDRSGLQANQGHAQLSEVS